MKLEEIKKLCKKNKSIILCSKVTKDAERIGEPVVREQWISDGKGYFLLQNCPEFSEESIFSVFDITDIEKEKYQYTERNFKDTPYSFSDEDDTEKDVKLSEINITINNKQFATAFTTEGAKLIDIHYFKPFADLKDPRWELFERKDESGRLYFAVKYGMFIVGIVIPAVNRVENFYEEFMKLSKELGNTLIKESQERFKNEKKTEQLEL